MTIVTTATVTARYDELAHVAEPIHDHGVAALRTGLDCLGLYSVSNVTPVPVPELLAALRDGLPSLERWGVDYLAVAATVADAIERACDSVTV